MRCPVCKIDSMRTPGPGGNPVDRCVSCGAAWFDPGEIRELSDGRIPGTERAGAGEEGPPPGRDGIAGRMAGAWKQAAALACPRCSRKLSVIDFRMTGVPVFLCRDCGGMLVTRDGVDALSRHFGFHRRNAALYTALGESIAGQMHRRLEREYGIGEPTELRETVPVPGIPVVIPLADGAAAPGSPPLVTLGVLGLMVVFHILGEIGVRGMDGLPSRLGLPPGAGFGDVPSGVLWLNPFFHGGIIPLATGCLFLFVLGDNVEERMGRLPFLVFYLACGLIAGAAHVVWGKTGSPPALGSAGAVAGVLGAYLVFFPQVPISMYGAGGNVSSIPAYLFACAWVVALFLWGWGHGPLSEFLNPAPYSLAGSLAGFTAGMAGAASWRFLEDSREAA